MAYTRVLNRNCVFYGTCVFLLPIFDHIEFENVCCMLRYGNSRSQKISQNISFRGMISYPYTKSPFLNGTLVLRILHYGRYVTRLISVMGRNRTIRFFGACVYYGLLIYALRASNTLPTRYSATFRKTR